MLENCLVLVGEMGARLQRWVKLSIVRETALVLFSLVLRLIGAPVAEREAARMSNRNHTTNHLLPFSLASSTCAMACSFREMIRGNLLFGEHIGDVTSWPCRRTL